MLSLSVFFVLVLNLAPSPTLRLLHHTPAGCFAVAAAAAAPSTTTGSLRAKARSLQSPTIPSVPQVAQPYVPPVAQAPTGSTVPKAPTVPAANQPSFASLVWGNNMQNMTTDNSTQQQQQQQQQTTDGHTDGDDARWMVHLTQVNGSTWRDPEGKTYHHAEYRASNTATRDICDVKVGIPVGNMDPNQVTVNNSYAMAVEIPGERSGEHDQMLRATLQPPYFRPGLRIREAVDFGVVLESYDANVANVGNATVLSARYCTEEESRASMPPPQQQQQQQQQAQQAMPQQQEQQQEQQAGDGRTLPSRAINLVQSWWQGGNE